RGNVRIENRSERAVVTGVQRAAQRLAFARFLADAFEDQHVRVDGHANRQHDARDAGQRERGADRAHDAHEDDDIQDERDVRDGAGEEIVNDHEAGDRDDADDAGLDAAVDRVFAEGGIDVAFVDDLERSLERVLQHVGDVERLLLGIAAFNDAAAAGNFTADYRRGLEFTVEDDGELPADVVAGQIGERGRRLIVEHETDLRTPEVVAIDARVADAAD